MRLIHRHHRLYHLFIPNTSELKSQNLFALINHISQIFYISSHLSRCSWIDLDRGELGTQCYLGVDCTRPLDQLGLDAQLDKSNNRRS